MSLIPLPSPDEHFPLASPGLAWKWPLAHGCFFATFVMLDWHFNEIVLPKNHKLISMPVLLGLVQWGLLYKSVQKGYLLPLVNILGVLLSFLGIWVFPALMGLGFGLAQALFFWWQGYRRTFFWIIASFCGWVLGAIVWGYFHDWKEFLPRSLVTILDPLLQPLMGAGIGYGLFTGLALRLLIKK